MTDTVKELAPLPADGVAMAGRDTPAPTDRLGVVVRTVDRTRLQAVQTPQGFRRDVLEQAHHRAGEVAASEGEPPATDDAGLVERLGVPVVAVAGDAEAFKVTRPIDLLLAESVLAQRRTTGAR